MIQSNKAIKEGDLVFAIQDYSIFDQDLDISKDCFMVLKPASSTATTGCAQRMHQVAKITPQPYPVAERSLLKLNFKWGDLVVLKNSSIESLFEVKSIEARSSTVDFPDPNNHDGNNEPVVYWKTLIFETGAECWK